VKGPGESLEVGVPSNRQEPREPAFHRAFIGLGSNLGDRARHLQEALQLLARTPDCTVTAISRYYETRPIGGPPDQARYLNAAAAVNTTLPPRAFLERLLEIERRLGRQREVKWGPRVIDLDLLLWDTETIQEPGLEVPHPHLPVRRFVLEPLAEIAPEACHPSGWTVAEQLDRIRRRPLYVAVTGPLGAGKTTVAQRLAAELGGVFVGEQWDEELLERASGGDFSAACALERWFLESRRHLLERRRFGPAELVISDFWWGQPLAYVRARALVDEEPQLKRELCRGAEELLEPTIVVWLSAEPAELWRRVQARGRPAERPVSVDWLGALHDAFCQVLTGPGAPPVFRPLSRDLDQQVEELKLVVESIKG
jgi:2-amino-4-hydroxy-6-hydroxymethyldihydropteridine diphosphokinase